MAALRYLLFAAVGLVVASVLFLVLSFLVSVNFDASVGFFERWIVKYTCDQYELKGTVRDFQGRPIPYAVVEASFLDERLTTRSNIDGTFMLMADESVCNRRLPRTVQLLRERGMSDVLVAAGGIIPDADIATLKEAGIAEIFGPGTSIGQIARYFRENVRRS